MTEGTERLTDSMTRQGFVLLAEVLEVCPMLGPSAEALRRLAVDMPEPLRETDQRELWTPLRMGVKHFPMHTTSSGTAYFSTEPAEDADVSQAARLFWERMGDRGSPAEVAP